MLNMTNNSIIENSLLFPKQKNKLNAMPIIDKNRKKKFT